MSATNPTTIYLSGGLGNQLHQLSVACGIGRFAPVQLSVSTLAVSGRGFDAMPFSQEANLDTIDEPCNCGAAPGAVQLDSIDPSRPPCCILSYPQGASWLAHEASPDDFHGVMSRGLKRAVGSDVQQLPVISHFRLGDNLWPRAARRYGVLSSTYYAGCLDLLDRPSTLWAATDDPAAVTRLFGNQIGDTTISRMERADVLTDFATMSSAESFIAANSTLSLWVAWYRGVDDALHPAGRRTLAPSTAYRAQDDPKVAGLGQVMPDFWHPTHLLIRHPWTVTRRLNWKGRLW